MNRIYIKGNGPTTACFLINFSKNNKLKDKFKIVIPDDWKFSGGYGFKNINQSLMMNSFSWSDSLDNNNPNDYYSYCGGKTYTSRLLYKQYMTDRCNQAVETLENNGCLYYDSSSDKDLVFITPGFERKYTTPVIPEAITQWYQQLGLLNQASGKVLILGMGLSAVDAITEVLRSEKDVQVDCYSRSGYWPRTHSLTPTEAVQTSTDIFPGDTLKDADSLYTVLHKLCENTGCDSFWDSRMFKTIQSPQPGVNTIRIATVMKSQLTNRWHKLDSNEKQKWFEKYNFLYSKSHTGMSTINANILINAQQNKQLSRVEHYDINNYSLIIDATGYKQKFAVPNVHNEYIAGAELNNPFVFPSIAESKKAVLRFMHIILQYNIKQEVA
jgi:uncharacterized NAD(P)/FAD-binding protein YdhS